MSKQSFKDLINGEVPVLVDFYAEWCGPCKTMMPVLDNLASEVGDKVKIIKIDVDKNLAAARAYQVMGVPTLVLFYKGKIVWKQAGVHNEMQLKGVLQSNNLI